ncbi:DUF5990 family protein [Streptomyces mobaraensis]|uniref:DUF5990 family protein n=1 Tax=Streptomyces mobaraensis TaxID=35621 RepID=UPI0013DECC55|nr:DUF5990 family protein [Streptomyces mobaraensis]
MTAAGGTTVHLVLTAPDLPGDTGETGLQDKSGALLPGRTAPGRTTRYELDVPLRTTADGSDFSGPYVHGTRGGRFLYLSRRDPSGPGWARRCKIMLPDGPPAGGGTLYATVTDTGGSRAELTEDGWTAEEPGR